MLPLRFQCAARVKHIAHVLPEHLYDSSDLHINEVRHTVKGGFWSLGEVVGDGAVRDVTVFNHVLRECAVGQWEVGQGALELALALATGCDCPKPLAMDSPAGHEGSEGKEAGAGSRAQRLENLSLSPVLAPILPRALAGQVPEYPIMHDRSEDVHQAQSKHTLRSYRPEPL